MIRTTSTAALRARQPKPSVFKQNRDRQRRVKFFFLWAKNSRPVVAAFVALMVTTFIALTPALLNGGDGLVFVLWMTTFAMAFAGAWQFFVCEAGYTIDDWRK